MNSNKHLYLLVVFLFMIISCVKEIPPEAGFTETFYIKFSLNGQEHKFESNQLTLDFSESLNGLTSQSSVFQKSGYNWGEVCGFHLGLQGSPITKRDIMALQGKNLSAHGTAAPYIRFIYLTHNLYTQESFRTENPNSIYSFNPSKFVIREIIKGPREVQHLEHKKTRTYILRGDFEFEVVDKDAVLQKVNNGKFSIQAFCTDF